MSHSKREEWRKRYPYITEIERMKPFEDAVRRDNVGLAREILHTSNPACYTKPDLLWLSLVDLAALGLPSRESLKMQKQKPT